MQTLLALFGFASTETQARVPALGAYLFLIGAGYFSAEVIELVVTVARLFNPTMSHYLSVAARTVGVVATLFLAHGIYRAVIHRDEYSWAGYIRTLLIKG